MATNNKNTDWRAKYRAMMTDPNYAEKMASAVENTRKVNTNLMNKSEELESSLSLGKSTSQPLDLSRVQEMQTEQAARATMQGEDSDYSGVSDLATKLYAEERKKRIDKAEQRSNALSNAYVGAPHGMRFSQAMMDIRDVEKAKNVQGIYDKVLQDESLSQAIHTNANKALLKAMEKNQSMSEDEQKKVYNESVTKQLEAIGKGIDKYLYDVNAPKSEAEWVVENAVNSSIMGQILTSPMNVEGGENAYRQQALADYGAKASWLSQGLSTAGSLVIDTLPMMGIGTAFAAPASKAAMWGVGKVGGKALQGSLIGRGVVGSVGGAATLGGYNAASTLTTQFSNGQFDLGEIASSAGHGAIMGGLTGVMSPVLRGVSQGMGKVGKVATMAGGLGAEAGIFTAAELAEMENPYDFETIAQTFGKNVAVIGGLKLSNLPKTLQEYKGWYNEGKQSNFTDADYKMMADFAKAKGFANNDAFSMSADGTYSRSIADRVTGNRALLELTKLEGGKERNLAMEMYQDPNVPLSMKTKIAAKMGLPAPNPVLPNAVEARDNVVNTYYEYREQMSDGTYVTRRILVDSKEMPSKRKARAAASEFGRTKARQNSVIQSEAEANTDATNAIVMARLTEQAWRSGTNVSDEVARMYDIAQRAQRGEASAEDIAYYQSVMEGTTEVTDRIKADIKAKTGVDIDEVLKQEGTFNTAQDKALTMYSEALASLKDSSKPTTERGTTASQASIADYIELKGMGIEQTKQLLNDPTAKVAAEKEIRNKYALWLKYFDGQMTEEQLASRLGYNLDSTKGLMEFVNEEAFFRGKAANRIAYNAANAAKRLLEQGSGGVRFTEDGKVKLQGVPYSIAVDESIVDRYRAAQQGSGENYQRIANDALKDIIRQSEQPIEEMSQQMATEEQAIANEPQTEQEAVTQQMVDNRLAEIDTDLQGIEADGIQRVNINDKPAMIVKGRIATLGNGEIDRAKSSTEVAYIPLDENGRPIKNEQGKPVVEVGVKPSNVRISEVEPWRTIEEYKRAEEQRIRDNNRITDEAIAQVGAEGGEVKEEMPTLDNVAVEPKDADELIAMCDGDKALALDVAVDELAKAQAAKGKGASTAETIDINRRIRTYQQIVDRLSASEMPDAAAVEPEQTSETTKAEPQVTEDMEFVYQQGLDESHDGMEPIRMSDGRYKWVGLQRGELTATMGERDVELLDGLAKKLGVAVIPISVADSAVNGYYRDGNIYVNTNRGAEWTMRWVAGHELLHDVAKKSPEAYDAYKQAVLDMWGEDYINDQVKQIIDDYAASGKTIDREQALTELVNDFGGELFNSRDGLNILDNILKSESRKGNTGFVNTIKQWWERLKEWFGGTPYANEVEKKLADAYKSAMKVMADRMGKRKVVEQQELATIGGLKDEAVADDAISNEGAEMSIVRDRNKIEELENEELVPMLRTFQILDGALYSPMATIQRGKKVHSVVEGDWWKADENADLAKVKVKGKKDEFYDKDDDRISKKDGKWVITIDGEDKPLATNGNSLSYYFNLKKGEKGDVVTDDLYAAYNPYIHASRSALNDQFKGAYLRPNLVLVEVLVPKSELDGTNRYKADYAKDGIGEVDWNSGTVIKQAVAAGHPGRKVALSRYAKIGKVFTDAEWADKIDEELSAYKEQITLPFIAFPPDVLRELANRGYKVEPPTSKKAQPYYEAWLNGEQPTGPNGGGEPITDGKRADESVLDYAKRVSEENAQPLPAANAKQSKSNSQLSAAQFGLFEDVDFSISRGNRATIEGWLNKRSDLSDKERGAVIDYIDKLNNAQVQLATGKWFASGAIRIPEDMPKVEQAYKVAKKAKVDMLKYASPMELINANSEFKIKEARINPNDVKELKAARSIPQYGIEIFDVEDSQKGQQTMRKIINTHWGKDANPWCLLQGDGEGNLTEDSWEYWNRYNAYPKKVAFKDGKLLAFSANDSEDVVWWDRNDKCHEYIPIVGKVPNDRYGRSALMEIHENGQVDYSNYHIGSENKDGAYMLWSDGGELIQSGFYKDGKFTGWKQLGGYYEMYKDGESYYFDSNSYSDNYRVADVNKLVYTKSVSDSGINEYAVKDWGGNGRKNEYVTIRKGKIISYRSKKVYFQENEIAKSYRVDDGDVKEIVNRLKTGKKEVTKDDVTYFLNADGTIEKEIHKIPYRSFYAVAYRRPDGNVQHIETIDNRGNRTGWVRYFYTTDGEKRTEPLDKLYNNGYPYNTKVIPSDRIEFDKKWINIDFIDPKDLNIAIEKTTKDADKYIESRSKAIVDEVESKISKVGNVEAEVEQMKKRDIDALNQKYADYSIKGGNTPERRADEVARLKQRIEQLNQEKDAIAEDGAKVKDIASEMTSFIKQNISTEVQSDMTRNQFKGILNQLENAVTKKDLEKPMQMIEHIGTNATRRSLTRQMRTFLKSEFKSMTPQGAVKAKTVDGATSRVLELAKTMYATMNKLPLGGEVAALQKQMRDLKADATEWANDQSADTQNLLADVLKVTERPAATRYGELTELRNKVAADGSASGEMLGYIDHMLDIMGDIDYFRGEQQKAKEASALNSKEDLDALKSELLDKSDKGILSEEEKAVLDNMPLYEMMVSLRQQQLDIDGGGAASIDAQIRNKQTAIKAYRAKMNELPKTDTTGRERYKALIEQVGGEIDDLFASRIVDQKAVNNGMRELIDDLVTLKEQGHSRLVEWSKNKQKRILDVKQLANNSFSASARGYWDEVNKKGHRLRDINNFLNNAKLTMISPALSFEYMLGTLDKKYYTNDSPIYNRFIKSQDGLLKANDNFFEGLESYNKEVNDAANRLIGRGAITNMAEWFKLGDRFATEEIPFAFEVDQMFDDGTVKKVTKGITATMTRGQAAKIYAWSRMADGMAKLKAHGVTDETIAAVKDFIGEGYMRFVDWVEDDFFPRLRREKYNPKYKEIYGISMAENEHYFPFAIYKKDVRTNTDLEQIGDDKLGGGLVGNLIERKRNNARLDFTRKSPDIFDMITRYGETMEEWTAYALVREDLKAMVNDKQFKVKCDMFGTDYYKHLLEAARVASRTSDDKALAGKWNTSMSKLQKVLASGAISMRVSTALKQLLSAPAFAVYSLDPKFLHQLEKTVVPIDVESAIKGLWKIGSGDLAEAKKLLLNENWVGHYNWCVNNLPSFRERVSLGGAGNPILEEKGFSKLCDAVQSAGMIPNRLVDAFTCSVGAKAVYEYNLNKYKKMYGEKAAHNMAVTEAEIAFNSSQQSSNPVFLSPMQVTKQFFVRGLMNFKNSPIGYLRAGLKANIDMVRAIKSIYNPTFKVDGQEMHFNSNGKSAASMLMTAAARSAMYNFYLNFIWNFGVYGIAGLSYTAMRNLSGEGNEDGNLLYSDEEWKKATGDNLAGTLFLCATQGLPYISGPFATAEQGTEFAPLMLFNTLNEMGTDIYQHGLVSPVTAQWITNLALKNGAGIDPQVCAQVYEGMQGILADRPVTEEDIMNLLASPRSAISGMTKQKVGEYDRMRDYVNARIKSNREIGIDERMDFGKALAGKRELRKSNLDYYIDEYLEANIPGYREISGRKSKETKQEEQANKKLYEQSMSLVEKIVGNPKGEADEQKASKIDSEDYDTKYKVRRLRDAVAAIHKLYAAGDYSTAEDIAAEMQRRIERGYDPNGKTLDERLKNVDIWEPAGKVTQDSPDGYYTNFDRAIGGEFKKMYVGKMNGEGN